MHRSVNLLGSILLAVVAACGELVASALLRDRIDVTSSESHTSAIVLEATGCAD